MRKRIPVIATNLITGEERHYASMNEAARQLGISYTCVNRVVHGKATNASDWYFRLEDTPLTIDIRTYKRNHYKRPLKATHLYSGEVRIFNGCTEAARELGLSTDCICGVAMGRYRRAGDWTFKYVTKEDLTEEEPIAKVMPPEEFAREMQELRDRYKEHPEDVHMHMDALMTEVLNALGYHKGIDIFFETDKYYA